MNFAQANYLYFMIPAFILLLLLRGLASRNYKVRLASLSATWRVNPVQERYEWPRRILLLFALTAMLLALARPRWDFHWADVKHRGSDLIVVLDLSRSMLATDVKPNRLERAKRSVRDLLQAVQGDRVGLILFSGVAFIQCPLTFDKSSFELFLAQTNTDLLPNQGTEIVSALTLADKAFEQGSEAGSRAKTVLLISDGEDHGKSTTEAAKSLADKGIRVFAIGMGAEGSPIPSPGGSFVRDDEGQLVLSKPDLAGLAALAEAGGGRLLSASEALDDFYKAELSRGEELKATREKIWREQHMWLSLLALFLLLAELGVASKKSG